MQKWLSKFWGEELIIPLTSIQEQGISTQSPKSQWWVLKQCSLGATTGLPVGEDVMVALVWRRCLPWWWHRNRAPLDSGSCGGRRSRDVGVTDGGVNARLPLIEHLGNVLYLDEVCAEHGLDCVNQRQQHWLELHHRSAHPLDFVDDELQVQVHGSEGLTKLGEVLRSIW